MINYKREIGKGRKTWERIVEEKLNHDRREWRRLARIFKRIEFTDSKDDCWLWKGAQTHHRSNLYRNYKWTTAHRFMYELIKGPIPEGLNINHKCDVALCCNPNHLYAGTQSQNMKDAYRRNRASNKGKNHPLTSLDDNDIVKIYRLYAGGTTTTELSRIYGIKRDSIGEIINGKKWTHVKISKSLRRKVDAVHRKRKAGPTAILTPNDVRQIRKVFVKGKITKRKLGEKYGVSDTAIAHVINGNTWRHVK